MRKAKVRIALARRFNRLTAPFEARFARDYRKVMGAMRADIGKLVPGRLQPGLRSAWTERLVSTMRPAYRAALAAGGQDFLRQTLTLRKNKGYLVLNTKAAKARAANIVVGLEREFVERLEGTIDTTFEALEDILSEAVEEGLDPEEVEDLIGEEWSDILGDRTDAIALTETNGAVNAVRDYLMREVVELQDWVSAGDNRVRLTHQIYSEAGSKPVGFDWAQLAPDAGYTLRYPCDPQCHEPAEIVNCRCFVVPAGEVDMDPEELADYLEDFEMDVDDVLRSEQQTPVYVPNFYTGKAFDPDQPRDEWGVLKHLAGTEFDHDQSTHATGGGEGGEGGGDKPSMTAVGRALVGAPEGMNSNPADFEPLAWGKTQVGEKRAAAIAKAEAQYANGITMKSPKDGDIQIPPLTRSDIEANLERLFEDAQSEPEIMAHKDWYAEEAGAVVKELTSKYADQIPSLGLDQVAGILAASSANNVWDDRWGTEGQLRASNQQVADNILRTWAENKEVKITETDLALVAAFIGTTESGAYKGMQIPEPGTYSFQELAKADPRLGYLFNTSWETADTSGAKPRKSMGFGGMPGHVIPSLGLLRGYSHDDVYGSEGKVRSFYTNIARSIAGQEDDNVTLDVWMARAMFGHPGIKGSHFSSFAPTPARYEYLRSIVAGLAKKHKLEPKQYQAAVWYALRNGKNRWDEREDVKRWNSDQRAEAKRIKDAAREAKKLAKQRKSVKTKAYDPGTANEDDDLAFAWFARFLAHERGADVDGDPIFGVWDESDEEAARAWRSYVGRAEMSKGVLVFTVKGDFEGHPFRGNQWTSGYYTPAPDDEGDERTSTADPESIAGLQGQLEDLTAKREAIEQKWRDAKRDYGAATHAVESAFAEKYGHPFNGMDAEDVERWSEMFTSDEAGKYAGNLYQEMQSAARELGDARTQESIVSQKISELKSKGEPQPAPSGERGITEIPVEARQEMAAHTAQAIKQSWPSDEQFAKLKAEESKDWKKVNEERIAPLIAAEKTAEEAWVKAKDEYTEKNEALGAFREKMQAESYKAGVKAFFELRPDLNPESEEGVKLLAERDRLKEEWMSAVRDRAIADKVIVGLDNKLYNEAENKLLSAVRDRHPDLFPEKGQSFRPEDVIASAISADRPDLPDASAVHEEMDKLYRSTQEQLKADSAEYQAALATSQAARARVNEFSAGVNEWDSQHPSLQSFSDKMEEFGAGSDDYNREVYASVLWMPEYKGGLPSRRAAEVIFQGERSEEYQKVRDDKTAAQNKLDETKIAVEKARSDVQSAGMKAEDEWAVAVGPGYFARRAFEDNQYYEKHMDELRGEWQHIGGEGPNRIRVATGIGLGLEQGAIYDQKLGRFLKPDDYSDLRDDAKTIRWAGLLQREYVETQEDIASGKMTKVEELGERHMGSAGGSGDGDDSENPDDWSDDKKYDMEKAHQDFWESDVASEKESEAQYAEWSDSLSTSDRIEYVAGGFPREKDAKSEAYAAAGRLAAERQEVDTEDTAKLDAFLKDQLGDSAQETDPEKLRTAAQREIEEAAEFRVRSLNARDAFIASFQGNTPEGMRDIFAGPTGPHGEEGTPLEGLREQITSHQADVIAELSKLETPFSSRGFTQGQYADALRSAHIPWTEAGSIATIMADTQNGNGFKGRFGPSESQWEEIRSTDADEITQRAMEIAAENRQVNLSDFATQEMDEGQIWSTLKDEKMSDIFDSPPKYSGDSTLEEYGMERHRENFQWDSSDAESAFDDWFASEDKSDWYTDEYQSAAANWEESQENPARGQTGPGKGEDRSIAERRWIKVYRGIEADDDGYVPNFVESWSTSENKARGFGSSSVMARNVPTENVLVFQGSRNWRGTGMGLTEYEVMVLSDLPKWYRDSLREYRRAEQERKRRESQRED